MGNRRISWRDIIQETAIDLATAATHEIIAAVTGKTIRVYKIILFCNEDQQVTLLDGSTKLMGQCDFTGNTGFVLEDTSDGLMLPFTCTASAAFNITLAQAQQTSGRVWYSQD